ncbi:MAG: thiol peroxidase [Fimbriimonadales bacterium]
MRTITLTGNPIEIPTDTLSVGSEVPDFEFQVVTPDGPKPKKLSDYAGKTVLFSVTPSIDTGLCATQAKNFDEQSAQLPEGIQVVNVSADLPFASARFAKDAGLTHMEFASDHKDMAFGKAFGIVIPSHRLLQRSALVVDGNGTLVHAEYMNEWTELPDFDAAMEAARSA